MLSENCEPRTFRLETREPVALVLRRYLPYQEEEHFAHAVEILRISTCCCAPLMHSSSLRAPQRLYVICEACKVKQDVEYSFEGIRFTYFIGHGEYDEDAGGVADEEALQAFVRAVCDDLYPNPLEVEVARAELLDMLGEEAQALLARLGWQKHGTTKWAIAAKRSPAGCRDE